MKNIGRKVWAIPGGHIPLKSSGHEPEYTSRDELSILNTGNLEAIITLTIFYADAEPSGPYNFKVNSRRMRTVRFNDLIDPAAMPLDTDYACIIESTVPVIVQFARIDTSKAENAITGFIPFTPF